MFEEMWRELAPVGRTAGGGYLRQPLTRAERECSAWFLQAAADRHLRVEMDGFGNAVAWWDPPQASAATSLLTGSHLDSVLDGGAFDGPLGVVSAFAAVDVLRERGVVPRRRIGVGAFFEEEGSRFGIACLGSRLASGAMSVDTAEALTDRDGVRLGDAWAQASLDPTIGSSLLADVGCFVELHVEQGRGLVHRDAAIGVASAIWPHGRYRFDFDGQANHAGTTRMQDRHDPMLTYATTALAADALARADDRRATFGRLEVHPDATNAVPSRVTAWLDARAETAEHLEALLAELERQGRDRAALDGTSLRVTPESVSGPVHFDGELAQRISAPHGWPVIPTMAGHDAGVLATAGVPSAMLFVRNPTGISHAPDERARTADCLAGVEALADTLQGLCG
jgi:beta-ureidopropionase / N-carbamoyl-L-amino-acid hydrolase